MKNIDITGPVMDNIVRFEKRRSLLWFLRFVVIVFTLFFLAVLLLWIAFGQIMERQTLELLTLFKEDREIIAQFWQDTLMIFWEELPQRKLVISVGILAGIIIFSLLTRKQRMIVWKRIRQIARRERRPRRTL
ncbi:hypothetical protein HYV22_01325 [Candidatus Gottesmanbacteria bacterium]|nr:hypothetical protein [Candidatus Gottesmanbacteria bacterium]